MLHSLSSLNANHTGASLLTYVELYTVPPSDENIPLAWMVKAGHNRTSFTRYHIPADFQTGDN
jgi:hypothetical protein